MSDYTAEGAVPVEDAAVEDPPTVGEVLDAQRRDHPDRYRPGPPEVASIPPHTDATSADGADTG
jgi:hypothetical protein